MAGNKKKTSSKKKKGGRLKQNNAPANLQNIDDVLSQADTALESSNIESAMQLYTYAANQLRSKIQALSTSIPSSSEEKESNMLLLSKVLGKLAEGKVSMGDQHGGQEDFLEATQLLSGDGPTKNPVASAQWKEARSNLYLYLGQLSCSNDALEAFTKAIGDLRACASILEEVVKSNPSDETIQTAFVDTKRQLCGAYCSVAELYLTDLCYEPNAEQNCESALQEALKLDDPKSSPDAVQAMANLRLSQNRGPEAVACIIDSYNRVKVGIEAMADLVGLGTDKKTESESMENVAKELKGEALDAANSLPGFEFRCQMSKLLLECGSCLEGTKEKREQRQFCVEAAIQVLGSLLAENDEVIETWFLLGCAFSSIDPKSIDASKHYFETSLTMLENLKKTVRRGGLTAEVKAEVSDLNEKIKDVKRRLEALCDDNSNMEED